MPPRRVLIVDDQDIMVMSIRALLDTSDEIEVVGSAWNGEEALKLVAEFSPDIVLMDIDMPVMDGVEATKQIAKRFPETQVLILSGLYVPHLVDQALRLGATSFLPKDRLADELVDKIIGLERVNSAPSGAAPEAARAKR